MFRCLWDVLVVVCRHLGELLWFYFLFLNCATLFPDVIMIRDALFGHVVRVLVMTCLPRFMAL